MQAALLCSQIFFIFWFGFRSSVTVVRAHHHFNNLENDRTNNVRNENILQPFTGTYVSQTSDILPYFTYTGNNFVQTSDVQTDWLIKGAQ